MDFIFPILFPIFSLIFVGYLYSSFATVKLEFINKMNMDVFLPPLLIIALSQNSFSLLNYKSLLLAGILMVLLTGVLAWAYAKIFKLSIPTFVPSMMFNNCGNMGLPLTVLAFGEEALSSAVVLFLASNLLHFTLGTYIVGGKISWWSLLKIPVNVATIIGLIISFAQWEMPDVIHKPIDMMANVAIPLMLVSLGVRIQTVGFSTWRIGLTGAILCPLFSVIIGFILILVIPLEADQQIQLLLFATLPPAVLNYMFAEKYNQEASEVASMVVVGNALSLFTLSAMLLYLNA